MIEFLIPLIISLVSMIFSLISLYYSRKRTKIVEFQLDRDQKGDKKDILSNMSTELLHVLELYEIEFKNIGKCYVMTNIICELPEGFKWIGSDFKPFNLGVGDSKKLAINISSAKVCNKTELHINYSFEQCGETHNDENIFPINQSK